MQKQPSCIKGCSFQKAWVKKSYEIKDGSHEMAAVMLMLIMKAAPFLYSLAVFSWYICVCVCVCVRVCVCSVGSNALCNIITFVVPK